MAMISCYECAAGVSDLLEMETQVEDDTRDRTSQPPPDLCLVIARHPEPGRLGDVLRVGAALPKGGGAVAISRVAPAFECAVGGRSAPLTHPLISRTPQVAFQRTATGWSVEAGGSGSIEVGGQTCRSAMLSAGDLTGGVLIHVNDYVSFHAHLGPQTAPERSERRLALYGDSHEMRMVRRMILRYGPDPAPVLISGETGTGKELVAQALHRESTLAGRADRLRDLNCSAITETLFESELFGHGANAFNNATTRQGAIRAASGGTLFLDEIQELPPSQQPKLLRAIESGEVRPVGADRSIRVDIRLICATNADLEARVEDGAFRDDLFSRIAGLRISLPPLNLRRQDIFGLLRILLRAALDERRGASLLATTEKRSLAPPRHVIEALAQRDYSGGNVRLLRNYATQVAAESRSAGRLTWPPVASEWGAPPASASPLEEEFERYGRNISELARAHGVKNDVMAARLRRNAVTVNPTSITPEELAAAIHACDGDEMKIARRLRLPQRSLKRLMTRHQKESS